MRQRGLKAGALHDTMSILKDVRPPADWHSDPLFEAGAGGQSSVRGQTPSTGDGSQITRKHAVQLWSVTTAAE